MPAELPPLGERISVTDGPFSGFEATVSSVDPDSQKIHAEVILFGRATSVVFSLSQISWAQSEDPEELEALQAALHADTPRARAEAAAALGALGWGARPAVSALRESLDQDPRAEVRAAAAEALGRVDPAAAEPALLDAVQGDRSGKVVAAALGGLAKTADPLPRLRAPVVAQLRHPRLEVRVAAVRLLHVWRARDASLVPEIVAAMSEEPDLRHRRMLALMLGRIGVATPDVVEGVRQLAEDTIAGPYAYDDAPWFVLGTLRAVDVLVEMTDPDRYPLPVQVHAAKGLCMCEDPAWVLRIVSVLERAESPSWQRALIERIGSQMGPLAIEAAPALVRFARQDGTHREAALALAMVGATEELCGLLRDGDDATRGEAAYALQRGYGRQLDDALRVPAMVAALADPLDRVRRSAAELLRGHREAPGVVAALEAALAVEGHALTRRRLEEALQG